MLQLGRLRLPTNLLLAPIARYCDLAFRQTVRPLGGLGLACTDLVNPRGLLNRTRKSMELVRTEPGDRPLCVQLYGCEPEYMAEAARWCENHGADVIDINMGCPADKIVKKAGGVALMRDPDLAMRLAEAVVRAVDTPVTVKMRLGWEADGQLVASRLAAGFEQVGVAGVTVHGRTAEQRFTGTVQWDEIARVVAAVKRIPVIGNGNVRSPQQAQTMIQQTGCAGVMIGRYALRDPWIFRQTHAYLTTGHVPLPPIIHERLALMNTHFKHLIRLRGERIAVLIWRQRASWYVPKLHDEHGFRHDLRAIRTADDYWRLVERYGCPKEVELSTLVGCGGSPGV